MKTLSLIYARCQSAFYDRCIKMTDIQSVCLVVTTIVCLSQEQKLHLSPLYHACTFIPHSDSKMFFVPSACIHAYATLLCVCIKHTMVLQADNRHKWYGLQSIACKLVSGFSHHADFLMPMSSLKLSTHYILIFLKIFYK